MGRDIRGGVLAVVACLLALGSPAASVVIDSGCAGMGAVASSEKLLSDGTSRMTLKATASDGYVFEGWSVAEENVVAWPEDRRNPGSLTVSVTSNAVITASFVARADDCLSFDISELFPEEVECGEEMSEVLLVDSVSFPSITFRNLPRGLSFDNGTLTVSGKTDAPGLYRIEADAVNGSGFTFHSCCTLRVRNLESARVSGNDTEIPVGDYFYSSIGSDDASDLFSFGEKPFFVMLYGSVPGMTWSNKWSAFYGTPTAVGEYTLKVSASFPTGRVETATMTLSVCDDEPEECELDLDGLEDLEVGDVLDEPYLLGTDSANVRIVSVTGLPTGLSAAFRYEDGERRCYVSGTVRKPGFFTVTVSFDDRSGETARTAKTIRTVMVGDVADVYLRAKSADPEYGTVSGGGVVSPVADVTLVATARAGATFAGWYDSSGEPLVLRENVDYRTAKIVLPAGTDFAMLEPLARFVSKADDVAPDLSELADSEFSFSPGEPFETEFSVVSPSLPSLTFKNLPKGMSCVATGSGAFVLRYDPDAATAASKRHTVTVTAVNASGKKASASFRVTVETQSDERIRVDADYGEFTPGEKIDPIDFSGAVDFARGETLSVSGVPKGLAYNAKANAKKGVEARTITGTPTVPGEYTLTFAAKVVAGATTNGKGKVSYKYETAKATSFLTVLPYPALSISVDEDAAAAGCKVSGAGNYKAGTKVSLKATAAKGWVFAGWEGLDGLAGFSALNPKLAYVTGGDDVWTQASFVPASEDGLTVFAPTPTDSGFAAEWPLKAKLGEDDATLIADLIETVSWPTVKVDGLPSGVKFSASTFLLSGKPTKSGVCHVTVTAKNAGGYSFVRVFDVAVLNADGSLPSEKALANAAEIDFSPLKGLTTGLYCPTGSVALAIGPKPGTDSPVRKVAVSGMPAGLASRVAIADGSAQVEVTGTPTKPGRQTVTVSVTYGDGKTLKSQAAVIVEDGGSSYLYVSADDADAGTVSGEGVYAAGATVKLVARAESKWVFSGWCVADGEEDLSLFAPLRDRDGIDPRTASAAFPFRPEDFSGGYELVGTFVPSEEDGESEISLDSDCWEIDPESTSSFAFAVDSLSVPKVTVTGLPKGVTVDAARGLMTYRPSSATVPGVYAATVSARNATQKTATTQTFEVRVANRVSEVIGGLDPDLDAYSVSVGTVMDPSLIAPTAEAGWKLTAKGLPAGLSFKNGSVTGVPTKAGNYTVTFTATSGKGKSLKTETATVTVRVAALPKNLAGTFTGVLADDDGIVAGSVSVTATAAGKVTVSAKTAAKTVSFAAKAWQSFADDRATVAMTARGGHACDLEIAATDDWRAWQASGEMTIGDRLLSFTAQRNPYGTKDGSDEARAVAAAMAGSSAMDGWSVKVTAKGVVSFAGKMDGKAVSGSATLQWDEDGAFARYVRFSGKTSAAVLTFRFDDQGKVISWNTDK